MHAGGVEHIGNVTGYPLSLRAQIYTDVVTISHMCDVPRSPISDVAPIIS